MKLRIRIRESNGFCIHSMQPKNGAVGMVSEPIATSSRILVNLEEQVRGPCKVNILLDGKNTDHCEAVFQLLGNSRVCDMRLCDNRYPIFGDFVSIAFALRMNGYHPSLGSIG
jgi:hypothetical protein